MGFAIFKDPKVQRLVETFGGERSLVIIIGAGASVEASLPTWDQFVERLLTAAADGTDAFDLPKQKVKEWVSRTLESESLLGAAGIADALSGGKLERLIPRALFGHQDIADYQPGPTLNQLARLRSTFDDNVSFISTNYDDLFEEALRKQQLLPQPYVKSGTKIEGDRVPVFHPHGFIGRPHGRRRNTQMEGPFIVSEEHFQLVDSDFAKRQETAVASKLLENPCLFVGVSLTDPNLLRYIYHYVSEDHPHAAIFIRQAEYGAIGRENEGSQPQRIGRAVQEAREQAVCARWTQRNLEAVFLDHFCDLAYLIHEISFFKKVGEGEYENLDVRTSRWLRAFEGIYAPADPEKFLDAQKALNRILKEALLAASKSVEETMSERGEPVNVASENLAAALWLTSKDGRTLIDWATTDRLHLDPKLITARKLDMDSRWISVKTVLHGLSYSDSRSLYESRWRYVVGLPLHIQKSQYGTLPVGCLTVTSKKPEGQTLLTQLPGDVSAAFKRTLVTTVAEALKASVPI
jgi:SIR2-like domain